MRHNYTSLRDAIENGRGIERPFNCPQHNDRNASASVNVDKNVWYCHVCQVGSKTKEGRHEVGWIPLMSPDKPIPALPMFAIEYTNKYLGYGEYWAARVGVPTAKKFRTGVDPITGFPTIPILNDSGNQLHGYLLRNLEKGPKYLYPVAVPVSRLLFGEHLVTAAPDVLVLVEGASDVLALHKWEPPPQCCVVAVYGSGLHAPQAEIIKRISPHRVVVAMDSDDAGERGNERSLERLHELGVPGSVFHWSQMGIGDAGEATSDPWPDIIASANLPVYRRKYG
jgi:Toprim domain-containing protein